jgi:N-acetylneuraminic acid mutarotase
LPTQEKNMVSRRRRSRLGAFLAFSCLILALGPAALARALSLEERVAAHRAVERVYWSHRAWPAENPGSKPAFETQITDELLRARVLDALRKSAALAGLWNRPIDVGQLQAEMERMARETKRPDMLRELFASLGDDPQLIAETLARPVLADRLIRRLYADEPRFHAGLRREAAQALAGVTTARDMRLARGTYRDAMWRKSELSPEEWSALESRLAKQPVGAVGPLVESDEAFYVVGILERDADSMRTATLSWPKVPFATWWSSEGPRHDRAALSVGSSGRIDPVAPNSAATCTTPDTWEPTLRTGTPGQRAGHTAVWTGSEMIVWGGYTEAGWFNTGWRYNPVLDSWSQVSTTGAPPARFFHVAVWSGSRMVVWGGSGTADFNNGGRYDPMTDTWTTMSTTGAPVARAGATAVWAGTRMIVWGGYSATTGTLQNTGGRYDPAADTWTATNLIGAPAGRQYHTAIWTGTRMVVWGGRGASSELADGRRYDPNANTWATMSLVGAPAARESHTAVWTGSRMVVWGGYDVVNGTYFGDGRRYDPMFDAWTTMSSLGAPAARTAHTAVWSGTAMLVWGGYDASGGMQSGGRYDATADAWTTVTTVGAPSARDGHTAVWAGTQMIISGGVGIGVYPVTGGRYDPASDTWTPTAAGTWAPTARKNHLAFWTGSEMLIWGGDVLLTPINYFLDVFTGARYDPALDVWAPIQSWAAGERYRGVWTGTDMLVVGGDDGFNNTLTQGFRYNLASDTWTSMSSVGMPAGRIGHTAVWNGTEMIVWGGHSTVSGVTTVLADGARYDPSTDVWTAIASGGAPSARENHSAVWTGAQMVVWGGKNGGTILGDGMRYTPDSGAGSWAVMASPALAPRSGHTAIWTGSAMIAWGGLTGSGRSADGASYDPLSDGWTPVSAAGAPTARDAHTAVWTGDVMIVWGGTTGAANLNSGGAYSPSGDSWAATTLTGAPTPRAAHSAVWAAPEMIVWSGNDFGTTQDDSGGRYCACTTRTWYQDLDGDGYGNPAVTAVGCVPPAGYLADASDCNDADPAIHPGAVEVCNGIDDNCDSSIDNGIPVPSGAPMLSESKSDLSSELSWTAVPGATGYDVVTGDLGTLASSAGDFTTSTTGCLGNDVGTTNAEDSSVLAPGAGSWHLVRAVNACSGNASFDEGVPSQPASRDAGIGAASGTCP